MRRFSLVACATALLAVTAVAGINESASAARKPSTALTANVAIAPNATHTACVLTISWTAADPAKVAGYVVRWDDETLSAKSKVEAKATNDTSASWEFPDNGAFYVDITVSYIDGRWSKPMSIGYPAWDCLG
jgi:hypothetical protein